MRSSYHSFGSCFAEGNGGWYTSTYVHCWTASAGSAPIDYDTIEPASGVLGLGEGLVFAVVQLTLGLVFGLDDGPSQTIGEILEGGTTQSASFQEPTASQAGNSAGELASLIESTMGQVPPALLSELQGESSDATGRQLMLIQDGTVYGFACNQNGCYNVDTMCTVVDQQWACRIG